MERVVLPDRTRKSVSRRFGRAGEAWLRSQPKVLAEIAERWSLDVGAPILSGWPDNVVYTCDRDGKALILKTGYPNPELFTEMAVLRHWRDRSGCVQLLDWDKSAGCLLLERILPGDTFRSVSPERRMQDIPLIFDQVPSAVDPSINLPTYRGWYDRAMQGAELPAGFREHANRGGQRLSALLAAFPEEKLLHGDLHHENMLLAEDGSYIAIDPKGVIGPAVLEYGRFLHNFVDDEPAPAARIIEGRLEKLSGMFDRELIATAGYVDLVLSSTWSLNDGERLNDSVPELIEVLDMRSLQV